MTQNAVLFREWLINAGQHHDAAGIHVGINDLLKNNLTKRIRMQYVMMSSILHSQYRSHNIATILISSTWNPPGSPQEDEWETILSGLGGTYQMGGLKFSILFLEERGGTKDKVCKSLCLLLIPS